VELRAALMEFRDRYNHQWILERLNYRTPVQARRDFQLEKQRSQHDSMGPIYSQRTVHPARSDTDPTRTDRESEHR
jgi:hypothetical protein